MGKYSSMKLPAFEPEKNYQEKVDLIKQKMKLATLTPAELGNSFMDIKKQKDDLEALVSSINIVQAAIEQSLLATMEEDELASFKLLDGTLLYTQEDVYASVGDREAFMAWVKSENLDAILSVNYQTMSSLTKSRLVDGEEPPPGVKAYLKTSVRTRKGKPA